MTGPSTEKHRISSKFVTWDAFGPIAALCDARIVRETIHVGGRVCCSFVEPVRAFIHAKKLAKRCRSRETAVNKWRTRQRAGGKRTRSSFISQRALSKRVLRDMPGLRAISEPLPDQVAPRTFLFLINRDRRVGDLSRPASRPHPCGLGIGEHKEVEGLIARRCFWEGLSETNGNDYNDTERKKEGQPIPSGATATRNAPQRSRLLLCPRCPRCRVAPTTCECAQTYRRLTAAFCHSL